MLPSASFGILIAVYFREMAKINLYGKKDTSPSVKHAYAFGFAGATVKEAYVLDYTEEQPAGAISTGTIRKNDIIELTFIGDELWYGNYEELYAYLNPDQAIDKSLPKEITIPHQSPTDESPLTDQIKFLRVYKKKRQPRSQSRSEGSFDELLEHNVSFQPEKAPEVEIRISMGDLGFSLFPLLVGHVEGDGLYSAELALDQHLNGTLSEQHRFGGYPGRVGTAQIFTDDDSNHPGAIVIGLGTDFESISAGNLIYCVKNALLKWSLKPRNSKQAPNISTLLVGSGYAGLTVREAIRSILTGVQLANIEIVKENKNRASSVKGTSVAEEVKLVKPLEVLEFIELFEAKALEAAYVIKSIISDSEFASYHLEKAQKIRRVPGARQTVETGLQSSWWHRLKVEEARPELDQNSDLLPLKFTAITDKARADEVILSTSRVIVDELVRKSVYHSKWNGRIAHTLFELLIPNQFKIYGRERRNILWILSKKAAEYPWELIHDPSRGERIPLSVRAGMVRQLSTMQFRNMPEFTSENHALVIGSPDVGSGFVQLPGAAREANAVSAIFKKYGFPEDPSIHDSATEIINKVHEKNYQIVHLAGHGILGKKEDDLSGMVIGKKHLLTSIEFSQKRQVPSIVFVNCCYLGKSDQAREALFVDRHKLAANLGIQFIEMGVKAVIAAGWKIQDDLAALFATTFYEEMFAGQAFGDAVLTARKRVFAEDPNSNTWGAYQCYGEPSFRLTTISNKQDLAVFDFVDPLEAIIRVNNITSASEAASSRNSSKQIEQLENVIQYIPADWMKYGKVVEAIGKCFATLNSFDEAIHHYKILLDLNKADYSVVALEELASVKVRSAIEKMQQNEPGSKIFKEGQERLKDAIDHLEILLDLGETTVRLTMMASALKRQSMLSKSPGARMKLWKQSYSFYKSAYDKNLLETNRVDNYPLLSFLTLTEILVKYGVKEVDDEPLLVRGRKIVEALQLCEAHSKEDDYVSPNFWDLSVRAPIYTYLKLIAFPQRLRNINKAYRGTLFKRNEDYNFRRRIIAAYRRAWSRGGTEHEKRKVMEHFDFIIEALDLSRSANKKSDDDFSTEEIKRMKDLHIFFSDLRDHLLSKVFTK